LPIGGAEKQIARLGVHTQLQEIPSGCVSGLGSSEGGMGFVGEHFDGGAFRLSISVI
jgi:hypothetical protein